MYIHGTELTHVGRLSAFALAMMRATHLAADEGWGPPKDCRSSRIIICIAVESGAVWNFDGGADLRWLTRLNSARLNPQLDYAILLQYSSRLESFRVLEHLAGWPLKSLGTFCPLGTYVVVVVVAVVVEIQTRGQNPTFCSPNDLYSQTSRVILPSVADVTKKWGCEQYQVV